MHKNQFGKHSYTHNECVTVGKKEYTFVMPTINSDCDIWIAAQLDNRACEKFCDACCGCFPKEEQGDGCDVGVFKTKTEE